MKFLLIAFALLGLATAATLPDSATQGPNPQDIATPEPEYIDIDEAPPAAAPAARPPPQAPQVFAPVPRIAAPHPNQLSYLAPVFNQIQPQFAQQVPGHYHDQSGYQYRRPVYIRRFYRRRY